MGNMSTLSKAARVPPELTKELQLLNRMYDPWRPEVFVRARREASKQLGPDEALFLQKLHQSVKLSTERALEKKQWEVRHDKAIRTFNAVDVLARTTKVQWYSCLSSEMPNSKPHIGKLVPPPIICSALPAMEVALQLRTMEGIKSRPLFLVAELREFDQAGYPQLGKLASQAPHCLPLRTDFARFVKEAYNQIRDGHASIEDRVRAAQDAYAFLCQDVTCFRGSVAEGYPFLEDSCLHLDVIATAMASSRPHLQILKNVSGERSAWYFQTKDQESFVERLNTIAHVALRNTAGGTEARHDDKPILVLPVLGMGLGSGTFHPRDAIAMAFTHWRKRFAPFFHSIYLCCGDRGQPDPVTADFMDTILNESLYLLPDNHEMVLYKAITWHWDKRQLEFFIHHDKIKTIAEFLAIEEIEIPLEAILAHRPAWWDGNRPSSRKSSKESRQSIRRTSVAERTGSMKALASVHQGNQGDLGDLSSLKIDDLQIQSSESKEPTRSDTVNGRRNSFGDSSRKGRLDTRELGAAAKSSLSYIDKNMKMLVSEALTVERENEQSHLHTMSLQRDMPSDDEEGGTIDGADGYGVDLDSLLAKSKRTLVLAKTHAAQLAHKQLKELKSDIMSPLYKKAKAIEKRKKREARRARKEAARKAAEEAEAAEQSASDVDHPQGG